MTTSHAGYVHREILTDLHNTILVSREYDHDDARRLVSALYEDQVARYGYADPAEADAASYRPPAGRFLVAYVDGVPAACGGFRLHDLDRHVVEIKKMFTAPGFRGRGLGWRILAELERRAREQGARRAILETGVRNTDALRLYTSNGYVPTNSYVCGRDPAINRAFTKEL
jgi:GNAT superfamily N-acetyltransferase